jgi:hypothetical protein
LPRTANSLADTDAGAISRSNQAGPPGHFQNVQLSAGAASRGRAFGEVAHKHSYLTDLMFFDVTLLAPSG